VCGDGEVDPIESFPHFARSRSHSDFEKGVEHRNVLREDDINARFPKLLKTIFALAD
jgi:hypothetical protein